MAYKPGSVLWSVPAASVIYLCLTLPAGYSGLPSGSGEQPSNTGIHDLATPGTHSSWCHHPTGELLPHLLTLTSLVCVAVVFFCVSPAVADSLQINKRDALCCPDFPHTPLGEQATDRPTAFMGTKLVQAERKRKFICSFPRRSLIKSSALH